MVVERAAYFALVDAGVRFREAARTVGVNYRTAKRWRAEIAAAIGGAALVDPMSALVSDRMRAVLAADAAGCDWVVLDTPPVELLPDAKLLSAMADVAILVVHAGSTKCQLSQRAVEAIGRDRILGVVLNQVIASDSERQTYSNYYGGDGQ